MSTKKATASGERGKGSIVAILAERNADLIAIAGADQFKPEDHQREIINMARVLFRDTSETGKAMGKLLLFMHGRGGSIEDHNSSVLRGLKELEEVGLVRRSPTDPKCHELTLLGKEVYGKRGGVGLRT
jgi:hypothetical protein